MSHFNSAIAEFFSLDFARVGWFVSVSPFVRWRSLFSQFVGETSNLFHFLCGWHERQKIPILSAVLAVCPCLANCVIVAVLTWFFSRRKEPHFHHLAHESDSLKAMKRIQAGFEGV